MTYTNYNYWKDNKIKHTPQLSIIIPAYNEAERILPTIGAMISYVCDLTVEWELIVADDGSTDNTVELIEELDMANVTVLRAIRNGGKGSAVQRGISAARGEYILFADADNSTPIEELGRLLNKVKSEGFDIAVGSRAVDGAAEQNKSFIRHLMSAGLRGMVNTTLNIKVKDTQCGFKLFSRTAAHFLIQLQTIKGFAFDLELLFLAAKYNMRIAEVGVQWFDAPGSKVDPIKEAKRFLQDITRIRLNNLKGMYELSPKNYATSNLIEIARQHFGYNTAYLN